MEKFIYCYRILEEINGIYEHEDIYIIWDGWSANTSKITKVFLDLNPRIKILPLPTRASWLNRIERDFGQIQKFVLNNSDFKSVKEAMQMIGDFISKEL